MIIQSRDRNQATINNGIIREGILQKKLPIYSMFYGPFFNNKQDHQIQGQHNLDDFLTFIQLGLNNST